MIVRTVITETEDSRSPEDNECLLDRCDTIMWITQSVLTHVAGSGGVSCWAQSCPSLLACSPSSSSAPAPPYSAERWELARCTDQTSHHHPKADLDTSQPETKRRPEETERRQRLGGHTDTGDQVVSYQSIRVLKPILSQSRGRYVLKSDTLTQTCVKLVALMPPQCVKVARPTLAISTRPQLVNIRYFSLSESRDVWLGWGNSHNKAALIWTFYLAQAGDFMSEAKDWAGELISGQTGTGRILVRNSFF